MIGIVAGIFCTLIVAWTSSYFFKFDAAWFAALEKPSIFVPNGVFTLFVGISYVSCILSISRLIEYKHIFPSMLFFVALGVSSVLFVIAFFFCKDLVWGLVTMTFTLAFAYVLFIRFLIKDVKIAFEFLPTFLFDAYGFICALCIALAN